MKILIILRNILGMSFLLAKARKSHYYEGKKKIFFFRDLAPPYCTYFIVLDLMNGFLQIPLAEKSRGKTAFLSEDGTYQFTRAMLGLKNAPRVFARLMNRLLGEFRDTSIMYFQDDILIAAKTVEQAIEYFEAVLKKLAFAGLACKLTKCKFGVKEFEYLGFCISENGVTPGKLKVEAVEKFPRPKNVHEIRRFIGLASFFRRFVEKFAQRATPWRHL